MRTGFMILNGPSVVKGPIEGKLGNVDVAVTALAHLGVAAKPEWKLDKVADKRRDMLLTAIVAIEMTIETIEGNFKLNQHKSDEDHVAVANALANQDDPSAQAIAKRMVALRPHLDYASLVPVTELAG